MKILKIVYKNRPVKETITLASGRQLDNIKNHCYIQDNQLESIHCADDIEEIVEYKIESAQLVPAEEIRREVSKTMLENFVSSKEKEIKEYYLKKQKLYEMMDECKFQEVIDSI